MSVRFYQMRLLKIGKQSKTCFSEPFGFWVCGNWTVDLCMDYKDGHLLVLSAAVSVSCRPGGMFSSRKADWNKQFAPACLASVAGTLSKEGPWLSLKYSFRLFGDKPVNSANKLFYPTSLSARGERKKKLKWNSSRLSTL